MTAISWLFALATTLIAAQSATTDLPKFCAGCNFAAESLAGSDFTNVTYTAANFSGTDLRRASFRGAKLIAANFEKADLRDAVFDASDCTACNFDGAKFDGATFAGARMTVANFSAFAAATDDANLRSLLDGCTACNFSGSHLAGRDLSGAALIMVDLSGADLRGTKFDGAILCWHVVDAGQQVDKCDAMTGAQIDRASFQNVQICDDPLARRGCTPVDAATLRGYTGAAQSGTAPP